MNPTQIATAMLALVGMTGAGAHHSFAMFDQSRRITLKGTVAEFQWTNPHAFIRISVPRQDSKPEVWEIELNSPNNLKRQGWKSASLKSGDAVTLVTFPLRDMDGHKGGLFISVSLPDGTVLRETAFAGDSVSAKLPGIPPAK